LSLDVSYPLKTYLYGIPERINSFVLNNTINYAEKPDSNIDPREEPYRLFNTDHFDDKFNYHSFYGTIPVLHSR
jgi:hypothetical protein